MVGTSELRVSQLNNTCASLGKEKEKHKMDKEKSNTQY